MRRLHTGSPAAATVGVAPAQRGGVPAESAAGGRATTTIGGSSVGGGWPPGAPWGAWPAFQSCWAAPPLLIRRVRVASSVGLPLRRGRRCAAGLPLHNRNVNAPADRACATAAWAPLATNWGVMARPEGAAGEQGTLTNRRRCQDADPAAPRVVARLLPPPTAQRAASIMAGQLHTADGGGFYPCT